MRVVVSGHEICGLIHDLAEELQRRGHAVTTVAMKHRFFPYSYDYDQYAFVESYLSKRFPFRSGWRRALQGLWMVNRDWHKSLERGLRVRLLRGADLYIRVWGGIPFDREVLAAVHGSGVRVASMLMGSDVRDYDVFREQYGISAWSFPSEYHAVSLTQKLESLRTHERYADAVFSVPDQMGLALRPYHHLQVPLRLDRFTYHVPGRRVPRVVHAPSAPHVKGTDVIEASLNALRSEGVEFELVSAREMSHAKLLELLADADVLVDELVGHGPGWLSFEALASGCAVATRYLEDSPECFRPPVWAINEHNITDRLRTLLTERELRLRLAEEGRRYVEANNQIESVVDRMLEKVNAGHAAATDYVPTYLTTRYVPKTTAEADAINSASKLVAGEDWYQRYVAGRSHDGLIF